MVATFGKHYILDSKFQENMISFHFLANALHSSCWFVIKFSLMKKHYLDKKLSHPLSICILICFTLSPPCNPLPLVIYLSASIQAYQHTKLPLVTVQNLRNVTLYSTCCWYVKRGCLATHQ